MATLAEAHDGSDAVYHGDKGEWIIVLSKSRDATVLDRANWDAALDRVKFEPNTDWDIETSGHWLVGHVDFLIVRPDSLTAVPIANRIQDDLADYPVLDDELHSQYEHDATDKLWKEMPLSERIECLTGEFVVKHYGGGSIFAAYAKDAYDLYERSPETYYYIQVLATE